MQEAVDAAKRVLTKEKVDQQLSGQTTNITPFMKIGDTTHPGKKVSINPQDSIGEKLENFISMMYKMSIQQEEGRKPFKPQVYSKRGRGQRRQNFGNRDRSRNNWSRNNDRQRQNFKQNQNRCGNGNRRGNYRQNIGRSNSRDRDRQTFRRNYNNNDRSRSRERRPTPRRILIDDIIAQAQIQNLGVDQILGSQKIGVGLDVLDAECYVEQYMYKSFKISLSSLVV